MSAPSTFDFGVRLGLVFIAQAAALSLAAVVCVLVYIAYCALDITKSASRTWATRTHVHWFFLNLLVFDLVQAIGGMMDIKWVIDARVTEGAFCTAQGVLKQTGDVGVALTSMAIAIHTFCVLVLRWGSPPMTAHITIAFIWTFVALIIGISFATHKGEMYYGNTGYWCWITSAYPGERLGLEYLWLYMAGAVNILLYTFLALIVKGFVVVDGTKVRFTTGQERVHKHLTTYGGGHRSIATGLLFYPAVYIITVLPIAVVRWITFSNPSINVPFEATAFADLTFASSGWMNVLLFAITRPRLLPNRDHTAMILETPSVPYTSESRREPGQESNNDSRSTRPSEDHDSWPVAIKALEEKPAGLWPPSKV